VKALNGEVIEVLIADLGTLVTILLMLYIHCGVFLVPLVLSLRLGLLMA
jgi:hypothetical protein